MSSDVSINLLSDPSDTSESFSGEPSCVSKLSGVVCGAEAKLAGSVLLLDKGIRDGWDQNGEVRFCSTSQKKTG